MGVQRELLSRRLARGLTLLNGDNCMKKSLLAVAVLGAFAGAANAQSSVTLYGIGEATLEIGRKATQTTVQQAINPATGAIIVSNVASAQSKPSLRLQDGNSEGLGSSRFGLRGVEALGGGLSASFQFEAGFRIDDGTVTPGGGGNGGGSGDSGGAFFGRTAKIGLSGDFGSVELGRMVNPAFAVQGNSWAAGASNGLFDAGASTAAPMGGVRTSNAIQYTTPNLGGFTAKLLYGAPEAKGSSTVGTVTTTTPANPKVDLALEYANGPIYVGFGYDRAKTGSIGAATVGSDVKGYTFGGSFDLGFVKPFVNYTRQEGVTTNTPVTLPLLPTPIVVASPRAVLDESSWSIGATMPLGTMRLVAGYGSSKTDVTVNQVAGTATGEIEEKAFQLGLLVPLSRRTTITSNFGQYKSEWPAGALLKNAAGQTTGRIYDTNKRQAIAVGVRHVF
jgi:predicted porin